MRKNVLAMAICLAIALALLPTGGARAAEITVSDLAGLQAALNNDAYDTVIVSGKIALSNGTYDGRGKTVRVAVPSMDENGVVLTSTHVPAVSAYGVFSVASDQTVTLRNMTVMGGSVAPGSTAQSNNTPAIANSGTLYMENVTITRSCRGVSNQNSAKLVMKQCYISRNGSGYGGGLFNTGTVVMDGCCLSENRSLCTNGGGGAAENGGTMYINNTVIANNSSTEIGGAINNGGTIYLMNSTLCGNVTTNASYPYGGIGMSGSVYAVNSILVDNYYIHKTDAAVKTRADLTCRRGELFYSLFATASGSTQASCKTGDANIAGVFANYRNDGVLSELGDTTFGFSHAALVRAGGNAVALYAPLAADSPARTGGVYASYFDYDDLANIRMTYKLTSDGNQSGLGASGTVVPLLETKRVATNFEGGARDSGVMGASGSGGAAYTVKFGVIQNGTATGISGYGDTCPVNTVVTVTAKPNNGYTFVSWTVTPENGDAPFTVNSNPYAFPVTQGVTLTPTFQSGGTIVEVTFDVQGHGVAPAKQTILQGTALSEPIAPTAENYEFGGWYKNAACTESERWSFSTPVNASMTLYAKWTELIYTITATPNTLAFGPKSANYQTVPAAQTVTVTNTGNSPVILTAPASTTAYDVQPQGDWRAALAPLATRTFTVQPVKAGTQRAGTYAETLTVSTDHSASANVAVSFTVNSELMVSISGNLSIVSGESTELTANVSGGTGTTYGYQWSGGGITATTAKVTVSPTVTTEYTVTVTDQGDSSKQASATVVVTPQSNSLSIDPSTQNFGIVQTGYLTPPAAVTFTVTYSGNYWVTLNQPTTTSYTLGTLSRTLLNAANSTATFTVQPKSSLPAGTYGETITVSTQLGAVSAATNIAFAVSDTVQPVAITQHPADATAAVGAPASFSVVATGDPAPSYQWQVNTGSGWTDVPGENGATYAISMTTLSMQGDQYRCVASNYTTQQKHRSLQRRDAHAHAAADGRPAKRVCCGLCARESHGNGGRRHGRAVYNGFRVGSDERQCAPQRRGV